MRLFMHILSMEITASFRLYANFVLTCFFFYRGSDESRCQVKMSGDMMLSFPAGIVNVLANNPNPAKLCFRIKNIQNLENILPNKQLINV